MRPRLKSVGLAIATLLLCLGSGTIVPSAPLPASAQTSTTQDQKAEASRKADQLLDQGIQQAQTSQYETAIQSWEQALEIYRTIQDRNGEANSLNNLGIAYSFLSQYDKAIAFYQQALPIFQQVKDHNGEAKALGNLGNACTFLSQYDKAAAFYQQALLLFQQVKDRNGEANSLMNLGVAYRSLSQYDKALLLFQQALLLFQQVKDRNGEASAVNNLGKAYRLLSQYDKAITFHQQALSIYRQVKDRNGEANTLNDLGIAYRLLSQYNKAITFYQQALPILQQVKDRNGEASALNNLGIAYSFLSQYDKAIAFYQQALPIFQQVKDRNGEANTLSNLGSAYYPLSQYDKAIAFYQQALLILQQIKDRNGEANTLSNLGIAYYSLSQYDKAITLYQQALPILQQIKDHNGEANALMGLGIAYYSLSQYDKAIAFYQQALPIYQQVKDRDGEGNLLSNIGVLLEDQKQPELAIVFFKQSVNVYESIREGVSKLPRESQTAYTESISSTYRKLADLLLSRGDILEAQQVLELLKIQELQEFDQSTRAKISSTGKVDLDPIEQKIITEYGSFIAFDQKLRICQTQEPVCSDYDKLNNLWKESKNEYDRSVASLKKEVDDREQKDKQNVLDPNNDLSRKASEIIKDDKTALIYVLVTDNRLWLILATKGETLRRFEIEVNRATLSKEVVAFRELMAICGKRTCTASDTEKLKTVSQNLHRWLMPGLLQKELKGRIQNLVFSLDRNLRYIPMSALYDGKRYLIEDYAVSTIASAKFNSTEAFNPDNQPINVLAAGFSETFPPKFPRALTNVPIELRAIVKANTQDKLGTYPGKILLNQAFNFDALQKELFGNNILHIATHGEFVPTQNSSYILSGNKQELRISQIEDMRGLGNLKLVVLSACQTALGKEGQNGVEINSVSISFLSKGAKSVLASLWDVNDISTSLLMQKFYQNLAKPQTSRTTALQLAQQSFLKGEVTPTDGNRIRAGAAVDAPPAARSNEAPDFRHPYYWSPFVLIGSGF